MQGTPRSGRLHIGIFGRRNAGKSSLINALANQDLAVVSAVPGTTTDPVFKAMEILPIGPVVLIDTAGLDDTGALGGLRAAKSMEILRKTDLAVMVMDGWDEPGEFEDNILKKLRAGEIPVVGVVSKADLAADNQGKIAWYRSRGVPAAAVSAVTGSGVSVLKELLIKHSPAPGQARPIISDLIDPGDTVVLVVPIDSAAPKGRLILPQVQALREILDHGGIAVTVQEDRLAEALAGLKSPPGLVVTDSQAFGAVAKAIPEDVMLTSFSILFARYKGDLPALIAGVRRVEELRPGDRVLVAEGCTHHRQPDDIGKVKIPRWLNARVGGPLDYTWSSGYGFPADLAGYRLVIHCGGCMLNRREMLFRIREVAAHGVPVVNYGVLIAYLHGILDRALTPLPEGQVAPETQDFEKAGTEGYLGGSKDDLP